MQPETDYSPFCYSRSYTNGCPNYVTNKKLPSFDIVSIYSPEPIEPKPDIAVPVICHCHPKDLKDIYNLSNALYRVNWCMTYLRSKLNDLKGSDEERDNQARFLSAEIAYDKLLIMSIKRELEKQVT